MGYLTYFLISFGVSGILYKFIRYFYLSGGKCPDKYKKSMSDQTVIITGASTGIGYAACIEYIKLGAKKVIMCSRNEKRGKAAARKLKSSNKKSDTEIEYLPLDLSSLESVEKVSEKLKEEKIDILILNAACFTPGGRKLSSHGVELMFAVTFLGHFYLVKKLFKKLVEDGTRVIATTGTQKMMPKRIPSMDEVFSKMEDKGIFEVFGLAKACMMLFIKDLDKRFRNEDSFSSAYHVHPGVGESAMGLGDQKVPFYFTLLRTLVMYPMGKLFGKTPEEICQSHLLLSLAPLSELVGGGYYVDCGAREEIDFFGNEENCAKVWPFGEEILKRIKDEK